MFVILITFADAPSMGALFSEGEYTFGEAIDRAWAWNRSGQFTVEIVPADDDR